MNKLAKGFLFAVAGIGALIFVSVLGINLYVESVRVQSRLEKALSDELRMPVKLTRMRFSLWSGLRVQGLRVADAREPEKGEKDWPKYFLEAPEISARIAVGPLFSRRLVVRELVITSPTIVWQQTRKGRWELPREARPRRERDGAATAPKPRDRTASPERRKARSREAGQGTPAKPLEFRIAAARLENARFDFQDRRGRSLAVFEGVTLNCPAAAVHEVRGTAIIRRLTLHDSVVVHNLVARFDYVDGRLSLPQLDAMLAGGNLSGSFFLFPEMNDAPFTLDFRFDRVDLNRLVEEIGSDDTVQKSQGKLKGYVHLQGAVGRTETIGGAGRVVLEEGRMEQYPLLQSIGMVLQIDELTRLELTRARLDFWVNDGRVHIDDLALESPNLSLTAEGESRFDGKLSLSAGLVVNPRISRRLPGWIDANFQAIEGSENRKIVFGISGTLERPETDLMRVMVGERLEKQAMDLYKAFRSLTSGSRRKKQSKKEKEEAKLEERRREEEAEKAAKAAKAAEQEQENAATPEPEGQPAAPDEPGDLQQPPAVGTPTPEGGAPLMAPTPELPAAVNDAPSQEGVAVSPSGK